MPVVEGTNLDRTLGKTIEGVMSGNDDRRYDPTGVEDELILNLSDGSELRITGAVSVELRDATRCPTCGKEI